MALPFVTLVAESRHSHRAGALELDKQNICMFSIGSLGPGVVKGSAIPVTVFHCLRMRSACIDTAQLPDSSQADKRLRHGGA